MFCLAFCWSWVQNICYDRHDIMDLIRNTGIPLTLQPRAVPIDPRIPMRPRNVAIVRRTDFMLLKSIYKVVCSPTVYTLMVQAFNLLPANADAGHPWDPFHDASYVRVDVDTTEILKEERMHAPDRPVYDAYMALRAKHELDASSAAASSGSGTAGAATSPDLSSTHCSSD